MSDGAAPKGAALPAYLREVYGWAYLTPWLAGLLDRQTVVEAILWGNARRLIERVLDEIGPGDRVLQPAAVYGEFSRRLAERIGPAGRLEIRDIAPLQVFLTRRKLKDLAQASVVRGDAAVARADRHDAAVCFFLLHEVPDQVKPRIVEAMLSQTRAGGKAVFVDYHRPRRWHPLRPVMGAVFRWLEPFAEGLWRTEIETLAGEAGRGWRWRKRTLFGGLYQVVTATAPLTSADCPCASGDIGSSRR